jgi:hypothetical protein
MIGSDGQAYSFRLKAHEDTRLDEFCSRSRESILSLRSRKSRFGRDY